MGNCCSSSHGNDVELQPVQRRRHGNGGSPNRPTRATAPAARGLPTISLQPMPPQVVDGLLRVIAHHLGQTRYALIGGVALNLLGSARATPDIDLLVPSGYAGRVADTLGQTSNFGTERLQSGRSRVWYNAPNRRRYNVDIMEPGDIHQQFPSSDGGIITVRSARLLRPALLLNYKCFAWQVREDPRKKLSDAQDILFLLRYMVASGIQTSSQEVNHATPDFFVEFLASYPDAEELFVAIGLQCR